MLTKFFTVGIIYTISFLGYNPNDFLNVLPAPIKSVFEQSISTPISLQTKTQTNFSPKNLNGQATTTANNFNQETKPKKGTATSSETKEKLAPTKNTPKIQVSKTPIIIVATSTPPQPIPQNNPIKTSGNLLSAFASINEKISSSVVNIYCQAVRGSYIETVVGSAVEIDPSGIYLTNAHVAIYVMISDVSTPGNVSCYIRESGPAKKIYEAKSIYIPSDWVYAHTNAYKMGVELTGTGENDYALIKRGITNPNLSANDFPAEWSAPLAQNIPTKGENIILAGYPVYDKSTISSALYLLTSPSTILNSFNLNGEPNALLDSNSTRMAQIGSSGGGAFDSSGNLFGIMDAAINNTPGELPSERIIGINYIKNDILRDTGKSFESFLANANSESQNFIQNSAQTLSKVLTNSQ